MKLTLHNPPEGFEAEAEFRIPKMNERFVRTFDVPGGSSGIVEVATEDFVHSKRIVLTPKKPKRKIVFSDVELPDDCEFTNSKLDIVVVSSTDGCVKFLTSYAHVEEQA